MDKKFGVYGSRSLKYGGELVSTLLCQPWDVSLPRQPHQGRLGDASGPRLIKDFHERYIGVFTNALVKPHSLQINWNQANSGPAFKYLKCLTQIMHVMTHLIVTVLGENKRLSMTPFFEFTISLLRSIPQHENLLRFMVLNQFNYIMFSLIFGGTAEIRGEFLEQVMHQFLTYVNEFLSESSDMVLLTLKQVSNPVIQEQQMLVQRMYDLLKDKLDIEQVCKIVCFLLHFTQHPLMTSAYYKYVILSYVNTIIKAKFLNLHHSDPQLQMPGVTERVKDLQMQSLYCITKVVKQLHEQTEQAITFFRDNKLGEMDLNYTVGENQKI